MGNGSICKVGRRARPGPARAPAGPGPRARARLAPPSRARPARFAGPGLPLPGRSAQISRSRSEAGPAKRKPARQTVLPGPVCGTSAGPLTHSRARAGGFAGPVLREAGRRGENRPGKSTLGGPGAATFDPAGARRCPCRARNRPRPGPPHLRPGPQLYPAASYKKSAHAHKPVPPPHCKTLPGPKSPQTRKGAEVSTHLADLHSIRLAASPGRRPKSYCASKLAASVARPSEYVHQPSALNILSLALKQT